MKWTFKWEPVLWLAFLQSLLALLVALPRFSLDPAVAAWLLTATSAVFAAVEAWMVRPFTPAALSGAIRTALTAFAVFGWLPTEEFSTALVAFGTMIYGLLVRGSVEPKAGPVATVSASPTIKVRY